MKLVFILFAISFSVTTLADTSVKGYTRADGTYVQPHTRSSPDSYRYNNTGSQTNGGNKRDEYSGNAATNKSNSSYGVYDNDNDGIGNSYDNKPESKSGY